MQTLRPIKNVWYSWCACKSWKALMGILILALLYLSTPYARTFRHTDTTPWPGAAKVKITKVLPCVANFPDPYFHPPLPWVSFPLASRVLQGCQTPWDVQHLGPSNVRGERIFKFWVYHSELTTRSESMTVWRRWATVMTVVSLLSSVRIDCWMIVSVL